MGQSGSQNIGDIFTDKTIDNNEELQPLEHNLPEEVLVHVLSYVDPETLVKLRLVCRWWKHLIDNEVWRLKVSRKKYKSLNSVAPKWKLPWFVYYWICVKDPFGKNLLKNHCGQDQVRSWKVLSSGGHQWAIEDPPQGADSVPQNEEFDGLTSCFATSFNACSKEQIVDLLTAGMNSKMMDDFEPIIEVSEWYAGRFDCGCIYEMECELLNQKRVPVTNFRCYETVKQWEGAAWHKVIHKFQNYERGVRFIKFSHGGKDTQFWAGHYGSKMSGACVKLMIPAPSRRSGNAEDESDLEDCAL